MNLAALVEMPATNEAYRAWIKAHPCGFVIDVWTVPSPRQHDTRYPVFHHAHCEYISPDWPKQHVSNERVKVCATWSRALTAWARVHREPLLFCCWCEFHIG